jgi:hypothetical protein
MIKVKNFKFQGGDAEKFSVHSIGRKNTPALPAHLDREAIAEYMRRPLTRSLFPDDYCPPGSYDVDLDDTYSITDRGSADARRRKS